MVDRKQDVHDFKITPRQAQLLNSADKVFTLGKEMTPSMKNWEGKPQTVVIGVSAIDIDAYEGSTELDDNLLGLKGIGGFYVVDTNDGLVMIDAGSHLDIDSAYEEINKWRPKSNVKAAVFTHHHVDHIFATKKFDEDADKSKYKKRPVVIVQ